jgi:hypothetical protein
VHIISAMEACDAYNTQGLTPAGQRQVLAPLLLLPDRHFGLVSTWAPFRLQFYCNGHSWLARKLTAERIG